MSSTQLLQQQKTQQKNPSDLTPEENHVSSHSLVKVAPGWTHVYDGQRSTDAGNFQPQHKLQLGHQDVDGSGCGEARDQRV